MKALRYKNLDEARKVLAEAGVTRDIFDDDGQEPSGLLSAAPEDRLSEEDFYRLFDVKKGTLVEVEKIGYLGFGPPAQEEDYMGFVSEQACYVLEGKKLAVEIKNCPEGARDIHHLEALVLDQQHSLDRRDLARKLGLPENWSFENLFDLICAGEATAEEIDRAIHGEK